MWQYEMTYKQKKPRQRQHYISNCKKIYFFMFSSFFKEVYISAHLSLFSEVFCVQNMYNTGGKYNNQKIFIFPLDSEGLETVRSVFELMHILQVKFKKTYKNRPEIKCEYEFSFPRFYQYIQGLQYIKLVAKCKLCSHQIVYFKNLSFEQCFKLIKFRNMHVHTYDIKLIREVYVKSCTDAPRIYRYEPYHIRMLKVKSQKQKGGITAEEYIKSLPMGLRTTTKMKLVYEKFGLVDSEFNSIMRKINSEFQIPLVDFFRELDEQDFEYIYLPKSILNVEERHMYDEEMPKYSWKPSIAPEIEDYQPETKSIHFVDHNNPHVPNILLIVTPEMKRLYQAHGQYVGFDLTFSIIRERPTHSKEYLVGVFGGTNESKRIIIYGLVITNNQSVQAYKYICTEFFKIMGKCPSTVITDEQQSLYYALRELKQEGIFTGEHLFDMFHILKKFRKANDGNSFQLFRKLMHSTSRSIYRQYFKQLMKEVNNDRELQILRIFDLNSEKYCYSQILPRFVGASISNSFNQKFHDILKSNLPYESKYIKAVKVMIGVTKDINRPKDPDLEMYPDQEKLEMPFLKPYRTKFSSRTFKILVREVCRSGNFTLLTEDEEQQANLNKAKTEPGSKCPKKLLSLNRDSYLVMTLLGCYKVFKKYDGEIVVLNDKTSKDVGKWHCTCQFQEKTGIICSHLAKVLIHRKEFFMKNLHSRWCVNPNTITRRLRDYKYVDKFLNLRSRHKIRVKGWRKHRHLYDPNYKPDTSSDTTSLIDSETQSIMSELDFTHDELQDNENSSTFGSDPFYNTAMMKQQAETQVAFPIDTISTGGEDIQHEDMNENEEEEHYAYA